MEKIKNDLVNSSTCYKRIRAAVRSEKAEVYPITEYRRGRKCLYFIL